MLVPENQQHKYVVSMFLATAGASGLLLGSDEKEIICLVFGIIDVQNKEVSDQTPPTKYFAAVRVPLEKFLKNMFCPIVWGGTGVWWCEETKGERRRF